MRKGEAPVEPAGNQVFGEPADVMTEPGRYDGYSVYAEDCGVTNGFPVSATGNVGFRSYQLNDELEKRMLSLPAYHGGPTFSGACDWFSTIVRLNDWRAVDAAIEIAGAFLVDQDVNGIVIVKVMPWGEE